MQLPRIHFTELHCDLLLFNGISKARMGKEQLLVCSKIARRALVCLGVEFQQLLEIAISLQEGRCVMNAFGARALTIDNKLNEWCCFKGVAGSIKGKCLEDGKERLPRVL
jgi:hypothetical protein